MFGLGFDTASEVALLALAADAPDTGIAGYSVMLLPALFAAGMSLVDTLDSVLMTYAYGWAKVEAHRKLFYNFVITGCSAVIALIVGGLEVLGAVFPQWPPMHWVNSHFEWLGFGVIAFFAASFAASLLYDQLVLAPKSAKVLQDTDSQIGETSRLVDAGGRGSSEDTCTVCA